MISTTKQEQPESPRLPACLGRSLEFWFELPAASLLSSRVHSSNILQDAPKVFLVPSSSDGIAQSLGVGTASSWA